MLQLLGRCLLKGRGESNLIIRTIQPCDLSQDPACDPHFSFPWVPPHPRSVPRYCTQLWPLRIPMPCPDPPAISKWLRPSEYFLGCSKWHRGYRVSRALYALTGVQNNAPWSPPLDTSLARHRTQSFIKQRPEPRDEQGKKPLTSKVCPAWFLLPSGCVLSVRLLSPSGRGNFSQFTYQSSSHVDVRPTVGGH